jgi:hypothetical protein
MLIPRNEVDILTVALHHIFFPCVLFDSLQVGLKLVYLFVVFFDFSDIKSPHTFDLINPAVQQPLPFETIGIKKNHPHGKCRNGQKIPVKQYFENDPAHRNISGYKVRLK